jgi:hypothetical protein
VIPFLHLALFAAVIFGASSTGLAFPVELPASKRTPDVCAPISGGFISRMRKKENSAAATPDQTPGQLRPPSQNTLHQPVVLQNPQCGLPLPVPITVRPVKGPGVDYKKASLRLILFMNFSIPSSYAKPFRSNVGWGIFFFQAAK